MTGLPGWLAVPLSVAESPIAVPMPTAVVAFVLSVGVTGLTMKHSPAVSSVLFGTPTVPDVNSPRQQYRPADVTVAAAEKIGWVVAWLTFKVAPIWVPLGEVQVAGAATLQRKNFSVPFQLAAPLIVKSAESFADTEPVPIDKPPAGMSTPAAVFGVVVS